MFAGAAGLDLGLAGQMADFHHRVIDVAHRLPDDDLVLAARLHHLHDAVGLLQNGGVGLALVLQDKSQPGDAVGQADNVVLAAHILQDDPCQTIVFVHGSFLLVSSCGVRIAALGSPGFCS